jgi:hypothetical protein
MRKAAPEGKGYANLLQASAFATLFAFEKIHSTNVLQAALGPDANNDANIEQIDKDLWRTGLPAFKKDQGEAAEQMVQKLRRVLLAYRSATAASSSSVFVKPCVFVFRSLLRRLLMHRSVYDPEVGYCQAMNFIAGCCPSPAL